MKKTAIFLLVCILCLGMNAQQRRIPFNGILLDLTGEPIRKARVYVKTPRDYCLTNKKGEFGLTNVLPTDTLKVELKKKLYIVPVAGKKSIIIRLGDEVNIQSQEDEGLISLGFSFIPRRERTIPGNFISGDDLRRSGYHDVLSALQGRIPGLNIIGSGAGGSSQDVNIRGTRSIKGSSTPIFFIDSMRVLSFEGLSLNDVDYVEVMKEASAYGSEGGNGAIIVHTKQ